LSTPVVCVSGGSYVNATFGNNLEAGSTVVLTLASNQAPNGASGPVTFTMFTTTDGVPLSGLTGFTISPANQVSWVSASRSSTYADGLPGGNLVILFVPSTDTSPSSPNVTIIPSSPIFTSNGPISCSVEAIVGTFVSSKTVSRSIVEGGSLVLTMSSTLSSLQQVTVTCTDNLADNVAGTVTFSIKTSTDPLILNNQVGYTILPASQVSWVSASRTASYISTLNGGNLIMTFVPTSSVFASGTVLITASEHIFLTEQYQFTVPDTFGPEIASFSPSQGNSNVDLVASVVLTFSENVTAGVGNVYLRPSHTTILTVKVGTGGVFYIDGIPQKSLIMEAGDKYVFDLDHWTNGNLGGYFAHPLLISSTPDGTHGSGGAEHKNDTLYKLNGGSATSLTYRGIYSFASATTRSTTFTPTTPGIFYYYDALHPAGGSMINVTNNSKSSIVLNTSPSSEITYNGSIMVINPDGLFSDAGSTSPKLSVTYTITIAVGAVTDFLGNSFLGLHGDTYQFSIDHMPPLVSSFVPARATLGVPATTDIVINFNEPIQKGSGNLVLEPYPGPSSIISMNITTSNITVAGTQVRIVLSNNLQSGLVYFLTMESGVFKDMNNNPYAGLRNVGHLTTMYYFAIADTEIPSVMSYSPAQGDTNALATSNIVLTFNEYIQAGTGNIEFTKLGGSVNTIPVHDNQVSVFENIVTINPTENLQHNSTYRVTLAKGVIRDDKPSTNDFPGIFNATYEFKVPPDTGAPFVTQYSPTKAASGAAVDENIVLTFSEDVQAGTGYVILVPSSGPSVTIPVVDAQVTFAHSTVTIDPANPLTSGLEYDVQIGTGVIVDINGNSYTGLQTYNFSASSVCSYVFDGFACSNGQCVITYKPQYIVCGHTNHLKYVAKASTSTALQNASDTAAALGVAVTVVQTNPLCLRIGYGNGLIWPEDT